MCRLCGDPDCKQGQLCNLRWFLDQSAVQNAIRRVQSYDPSFTAISLGSLPYYLRARGGARPAPVTGVWRHFQGLGNAGYTCPYCRRALRGGYHVDHITPWQAYIRATLGLNADAEGNLPSFIARVLASDPANLHLVCASCNESKGDMEANDPNFPAWLARRQAWGAQQMALAAQPPPLPQPPPPQPPLVRPPLPPLPQWQQDRLQRHLDRVHRIWGDDD